MTNIQKFFKTFIGLVLLLTFKAYSHEDAFHNVNQKVSRSLKLKFKKASQLSAHQFSDESFRVLSHDKVSKVGKFFSQYYNKTCLKAAFYSLVTYSVSKTIYHSLSSDVCIEEGFSPLTQVSKFSSLYNSELLLPCIALGASFYLSSYTCLPVTNKTVSTSLRRYSYTERLGTALGCLGGFIALSCVYNVPDHIITMVSIYLIYYIHRG